MYFQKAIKSIRGELGFTQAELARSLKVSVVTVSRWENGKTKPNTTVANKIIHTAKKAGASQQGLNALQASLLIPATKGKKRDESNSVLNGQTHLQDVIDRLSIAIGVFQVFADGRIKGNYLNDAYYSLIGKKRENRKKYFGFSAINAVFESDRKPLLEEIYSAIYDNRRIETEIRVIVDNDEYKRFQINADAVEREGDVCLLYCVFDEDEGSNRKETNRTLLDLKSADMSTEEAAVLTIELLKTHFDIVRLVDPKQSSVFKNPSKSNVETHTCYAVWGKASRCNNCISLKALNDKKRYSKLEYSKNGLYFVISQYVPFEKSGAVIEMVTKLDDDYVDNVFNKELLYANLDAINRQLEHDELTGVYNRRYLDNNLNTIIEEAKKSKKDIAIAMLDMDGFKKLNDALGHLAGDAVLIKIAKLLEKSVDTAKGEFVARFGGDEFLMLCKDLSRQELKERLEKVVELVEGLEIDGKIKAGISVGVAALSENPKSNAIELIDIADKKLYKAKQFGKGKVV